MYLISRLVYGSWIFDLNYTCGGKDKKSKD